VGKGEASRVPARVEEKAAADNIWDHCPISAGRGRSYNSNDWLAINCYDSEAFAFGLKSNRNRNRDYTTRRDRQLWLDRVRFLRAALAPSLPSAVRVFFGRWATVLFRRAALAAFLIFRFAAARCFLVVIYFAERFLANELACGKPHRIKNGTPCSTCRELEVQTQRIGHRAIYEDELQRIWPLDEENRRAKIEQFVKEHGFKLSFYKHGLCAIFEKEGALSSQ
jgi:hypothetical protein